MKLAMKLKIVIQNVIYNDLTIKLTPDIAGLCIMKYL